MSRKQIELLARSFIDNAAVDSSSEDETEEDEEDEADNFLVREDELRANSTSFDIEQFMRDQDAELQADEVDDLEAIASELKKRAQSWSQTNDEEHIPTPAHTPTMRNSRAQVGPTNVRNRMESEFDALKTMWMIPAIRSLESHYAGLITKALPSPAFAFFVPKLPGRIYAVADSRLDIERACSRYKGMMSWKLTLVPEEDRRHVVLMAVHRRHDIPGLRQGSFVRIRKGLHSGDIAYVVGVSAGARPILQGERLRQEAADSPNPAALRFAAPVSQSRSSTPLPSTQPGTAPFNDVSEILDDILDLLVVPRIDFDFSRRVGEKNKHLCAGPSKRRRVTVDRPTPALFDPKRIETALHEQKLSSKRRFKVHDKGDERFIFLKKFYECGLEQLRVFGIHAVESIHATPEDIMPFIGTSIDTAGITNAAYTRLDDRVKTKKFGPGVVVNISRTTFSVLIESGTKDEKVIEVMATDFDREFSMGQWVEIKLGRFAGRTGAVVGIEGAVLTLADPSNRLVSDIPSGCVQHTATPFEFKNIRPRCEAELLKQARTSGLVDKQELINSFINKEIYVLRGPVKGRVGRAIGVGSKHATVVFDGSIEKSKILLTDAINIESMLYLNAVEPDLPTLVWCEYIIMYLSAHRDKDQSAREPEDDESGEGESALNIAKSDQPGTGLSFETLPSIETSGAWLWTPHASTTACKYTIYGELTIAGGHGSNSGQACWTVPKKGAYIKKTTDKNGKEQLEFKVPIRYTHKNGTGIKDMVARPTDIDVHRPAVGNPAYVVRGKHKQTIVKIAEIRRDKSKAIIGYKAKLWPFAGRAKTIEVGVLEVTKIAELDIVDQPDEPTVCLDPMIDSIDQLIELDRVFPN